MSDDDGSDARDCRRTWLVSSGDAESYDFLEKIASLEVAYPNDLVRCHRNCLVNPSHIKEIHLKDRLVVLGQQEVYKVSFSRRRQQHLLQFWLTKGIE